MREKTFLVKRFSQGKPPARMLHANSRKPFFAPVLQPKLTVNAPNDIYEKEADTVADRVMKQSAVDDVTPVLQRKAKNENVEANPAIASALKSGNKGTPLAEGTLRWMERRTGADFSDVKVHTDASAVQLNSKLNAKAVTHGSDIYFNRGEYAPETNEGKRLLAHELTHVVQQRTGGSTILQRDEDPVPSPDAGDNNFDFDFDVLPPSLKFTLGNWMLQANTGSAELQFSRDLLRYRVGYSYGGDIFAGFNASGFGTRLGFNPESGAASFGFSRDRFRFGSSVSPIAGSVGFNLGYGAPLLPTPRDLSTSVYGGWAGASSILGDLSGMHDPISFYQAHNDDIDAVMGAVRALQPLADEERARFGAGLRFTYNPDTGALLYGGMQWFF